MCCVCRVVGFCSKGPPWVQRQEVHLPRAKPRDRYCVAVARPQMEPETGTWWAPCAGAAVPAHGLRPVPRLPDHHLCVCVSEPGSRQG